MNTLAAIMPFDGISGRYVLAHTVIELFVIILHKGRAAWFQARLGKEPVQQPHFLVLGFDILPIGNSVAISKFRRASVLQVEFIDAAGPIGVPGDGERRFRHLCGQGGDAAQIQQEKGAKHGKSANETPGGMARSLLELQ
jgi:hypothetical protein